MSNNSKTSSPQDYLKGPFDSEYINDTNALRYGSGDYLISNLLSEEELEANFNIMDKNAMVIWQILSENFIKRHLYDLDLRLILKYQVLSTEYLTILSDAFLNNYITNGASFNKDNFVYHHKYIELLATMFTYQNVPREIILKTLSIIKQYAANKLGITDLEEVLKPIITYQVLDDELKSLLLNDEDFKYCRRLIMTTMTQYQELTPEFIEDNPILAACNPYAKNLQLYQALGQEFYTAHGLKVQNNSLYTINDWKYRTSLWKDKYKDGIYAYKLIRVDRYSIKQYRYKYMENEEYITFSDYSLDLSSFGFGATSIDDAIKVWDRLYNGSPKFTIVKVKIAYKDITYFSMNDHDPYSGNSLYNTMIRAKKITILEEYSTEKKKEKLNFYKMIKEKVKSIVSKQPEKDYNVVVIHEDLPKLEPTKRHHHCSGKDKLKLHEMSNMFREE